MTYQSGKSGAGKMTEAGVETARETASTARQAASSGYEKAKEGAGEAMNSAVETAREYTDKATSSAGATMERGKEMAGEMFTSLKEGAESQKVAAADAVANLSHRAGEAADSLEETSPQLANALRKTASVVETAATDVRDKDFDELAHAVAEFGRRRPFAMLAMGVVGGVVLGRLLSSSDRRA
jgi:ElaB/YqjD/DUF883 family membrane-anchored ribosome-binding protein